MKYVIAILFILLPITLLADPAADRIRTNTTNFDDKLSASDDDVQSALDTLDDHNHDSVYVNVSGDTMTGDLKLDDNKLCVDDVCSDYIIRNSNYMEFYVGGALRLALLTTPVSSNFLLETGDVLLLETGDKLLLQ